MFGIFFCICQNIVYLIINITIFFLLLFFPSKYFILLYSSFYLDEINEIISFPIEKLNLIEHTNITCITEILNINNVTQIKEINNNKESFINNLLNFTIINNNVKFESSITTLKSNNCIVGLLFLIKSTIICTFKSPPKFVLANRITFLIIFISLSFFSIILEIIAVNDSKKLIDSITKFSNKINKFFKIVIPDLIEDKINELNSSIKFNICTIICTILIFIAIPAYYLRIMLVGKLTLKTYNDYLKNRIN